MKHSDIIVVDYARGVVRPVARVTCNGSVQVEAPKDLDEWKGFLLVDRWTEFGEPIHQTDSKAYLEQLIEDMARDSYVRATDVHDDGPECLYPDLGVEAPMQELSAS